MDPADIFGQKVRTSAEEAWHTEQNRRKYDIIRVKNPIIVFVKKIEYTLPPIDFYQEYDVNQFQKISFGETIDLPRYIARLYVEHKKDEIVNFVSKKLHDEFLAERDKKGLPRFVDKAIENRETYETQEYPKTNELDVINELYDQLWIGLVHEFGKDRPPANVEPSGIIDFSSVSMKAIENLNNKRVEGGVKYEATPYPPTPPQPSTSPVETPKADFVPNPFVELNQTLGKKVTPEEVSNE